MEAGEGSSREETLDAWQNVDPTTYLPSTEYAMHGTCWGAFMRGEETAPDGLPESDRTHPALGKVSDYHGPYGGSDTEMPPELQALQQAIEVLHQLMTVLPDPNATNVVGKCLAALTGLQNTMMQEMQQGPGGARQAVVSQLQGAGQGAPGGGPQY